MTKENREKLYHELFDAMCNRGNPEWMLLDLENLYVELKKTEDALFMRRKEIEQIGSSLRGLRLMLQGVQNDVL